MLSIIIIILLISIIILIQKKAQIANNVSEIQRDYEQKIYELKIAYDNELKIKTKQALDRSRYTLKGNISEIFCPFHKGFPYMAADCTFVGKPIDFIIFNNLEAYREGQKTIDDIEIIFVEVKSNHQASLSKVQDAIQKAVQKGKVKFETYKYDELTIQQSKIAVNQIETNIDVVKPLDLSELDKKYDKSEATSEIMARRREYPRHSKTWSKEEENMMINKITEGFNLNNLSILFGRSCTALTIKLNALGVDIQDI
ncbi:Predicted secreted endonuclease distantly related to archaeal Holliday junction resolvase [Commensalibacter communis]|uniref:Predicted secreted endonuclease distantly related to archaeal Holliday junction resolvase n=1 Tax=Commensalibacter communis TaxID=2972786 RepID=A0A9W4TNG2_9PROT|nr:Holliday junction resolvase-like protein [Commensalibacter communis]CAI3943005.1 Predicted secreted endonuclease distantly related to archaeal Holliday junction resolvase [Commensalibacter communis]CAI3951562.1 Predicted secreted endonuclease distantly related to archaeal Holliday junction resolvase [Commensalibacter communis]CAI3953160.1 Predicted secreted endonuclease distantly related to archaeal Holliday junction resolvase [Commensalibacter communis]CAI3960398.1 Predicted secreted endonu